MSDNGIDFNIIAIGTRAFKGYTNLKKVTVGNRVKTIGKECFSGCKKLRSLVIKSKKLKAVGKSAIKNIYPRATITVPSNKLKAYKKLFRL